MEDLEFSCSDTGKQQSALQAEWLESQLANKAKNSDTCLSLAFAANDKQEPANEKTAITKLTADELDRELKDFADRKLSEPSRDMLKFQKAVGKFCDSADKEAGFDELADTWSKINSLIDLKADALYKETKAEAANTPGRKELLAEVKAKQDRLWDKVMALPLGESFRIQDLLMRQPGESKAQQDERIRKGLANNKPILDAYNEIGVAEGKVEANKGPREKQLESLSKQLDSDSSIMKAQMEKAYLRSTIKN